MGAGDFTGGGNFTGGAEFHLYYVHSHSFLPILISFYGDADFLS
jgi:hypothetical protein